MRTSLLLIAILVATALSVRAQSANVEVTASAAPVDMLTLQDVDFINSTAPKWLFTITLRDRAVSAPSSPINAVMHLSVDVTLTDGESFPNALHYATKPFTIAGTRSFTNLDLRKSDIVDEYGMETAAKRRLEEVALPSGILPAGIYMFHILVQDAQHTSTTLGQSSFKFVLSNPSRIDLVFPLENDASVGQFPLFQWNYDGVRARISIFEELPGQTSAADVASGIPNVSVEVTGNSFLYPSAGVRPLEPGKTYVWFVEGLYSTTGGNSRSIRSALRSFTVREGGANAAIQSLLVELEKAMGPKYKSVFDRIKTEALSPTGQIKVNGAPITTSDLVRLIALFRENPANILDADIE
jgi:hypothetical protein